MVVPQLGICKKFSKITKTVSAFNATNAIVVGRIIFEMVYLARGKRAVRVVAFRF